MRTRAVAGTTLAALALGASSAGAFVTNDITDYNVCESVGSPVGGWTTTDASHHVNYRWLDDPNHSTVVSTVDYYNLAFIGKADIPAHNTGYFMAGDGANQFSFKLRSRTNPGGGCMYDHDGRVQR